MFTADALSRAPVPETIEDSLQEEVEDFVEAITQRCLPATPQRLGEYRKAQEQDAVCEQVRQYCMTEWPQKKFISSEITPYYKFKDHLTVCDNLLLFNNRIVVPKSLQRETLERIHAGHQGIERCRARVTMSVWWHGVMHAIAQLVQNCRECAEQSRNKRAFDHDSTTGIPVAVSRNRFIRARQVSVLASGGLLFDVSRSGQTELNYLKPSHCCTENDLRPSWYPRNSSQ